MSAGYVPCLVSLCFPLAGARQPRIKIPWREAQPAGKDEGRLGDAQRNLQLQLTFLDIRAFDVEGRVAPAGSLVVCRELHVD